MTMRCGSVCPAACRLSSAAERGLTVLEVMLAVVVLGIVSVAVLTGIVSGDRVASKGARTRRATTLARNHAEMLQVRAQTQDGREVSDTSYEEVVDDKLFLVEHSVVDSAVRTAPGNGLRNYELEVRVIEVDRDDTLTRFRMVQGYLE
jgi:prepilin-type N-terminal cleavage/methylation domain-containing protein